jgi:hypothetical protein
VEHTRLPSLEDKDKLPYLNAVILESFRIASLVNTIKSFSVEAVHIIGIQPASDLGFCFFKFFRFGTQFFV